MILVLNNKSEYTDNFISFLIEHIKLQGIASIDPQRLPLLDRYIETIFKKDNISSTLRPIRAKNILIACFSNIVSIRSKGTIKLMVDPNVLYPYTHIKLITLGKTINEGTADFKGYPLITNVFNKVERDINLYYTMYKGIA